MSDSDIIADWKVKGVHMPLARPVWDGGRIIAFFPACPCGWSFHFYWVTPDCPTSEARSSARLMAEAHVQQMERNQI